MRSGEVKARTQTHKWDSEGQSRSSDHLHLPSRLPLCPRKPLLESWAEAVGLWVELTGLLGGHLCL